MKMCGILWVWSYQFFLQRCLVSCLVTYKHTTCQDTYLAASRFRTFQFVFVFDSWSLHTVCLLSRCMAYGVDSFARQASSAAGFCWSLRHSCTRCIKFPHNKTDKKREPRCVYLIQGACSIEVMEEQL